jgi:NTE family protein
VRLPWDLKTQYNIDPDALPIVDAVRASMSIPFFFEPYTLPNTKVSFVDGGMLQDFPIEAFDRPDGQSRWPTFGVKLSTRPDPQAKM